MKSNISIVGLTLVTLMATAPMAVAETINLTADLKGPATNSNTSGTLEGNYDTQTKTLAWTVRYAGLSGAPTAAHFHGPANPDTLVTGKVHISGSLASPMKGSAVLTDPLARELLAGQWHFDIHTAANPRGELRGQITTAK